MVLGVLSKNKRPDSLLSQQKLPTWQPIINFRTMWKVLVGYGGILFAIGIGLVITLLRQKDDIRVPYYPHKTENNCIEIKNSEDSHKCTVNFQVTGDMELPLPVFVYYEITNFYQNHRSFVSNKDNKQLLGKIYHEGRAAKLDSDGCKYPYRCEPNPDSDDKICTQKTYFPCGAIANSFFSDKFDHLKNTEMEFKLSQTEEKITWPTERKGKYVNPHGINSATYDSDINFKGNFTMPKDWTEDVWKDWWKEGGIENPHFVNWMHPAPDSKFRKLYAVIDTNDTSEVGCASGGKGGPGKYLCAGNYTIEILSRWPPKGFNTIENLHISLILSTTTYLGSGKPFMAWFTLTVGLIVMSIGIIFLVLHKTMKPKIHPRLSLPSKSDKDTIPIPHNLSTKSVKKDASPRSTHSTLGSVKA